MLAPGVEVDGFRLLEALGRGAMGEVFRAEDLVLGRAVALKFLSVHRLDAEGRERFALEARAIARLGHPNIPAIYRVGEFAGQPYLVSELVEGASLASLPLPLAWQEARRIVLELARALRCAHEAGVLHRDVKPSNVIMTPSGLVKLCDFGLAKLMASAAARAVDTASAVDTAGAGRRGGLPPDGGSGDQVWNVPPSEGGLAETRSLAGQAQSPEGSAPATAAAWLGAPCEAASPAPAFGSPLTELGALVGTPLYMAPELWRGEAASPRSDLYALGVLAFELCTGRPPITARELSERRSAVLEAARPSLLERLPRSAARFAAAVDRCLRVEPALRFEGAAELEAALQLERSGDGARRAVEHAAGGTSRVGLPPSPYRGLEAFGAEHRDLFFGRQAAVEQLTERLRRQPLLIVAGDSGVGKSSICFAALLPWVEDGALGAERRWSTVRLVPGRSPLRATAEALHRALAESGPTGDDAGGLDGVDPRAEHGVSPDALGALLVTTPGDLARLLASRAGGGARGLVLAVDQLEELFTQSDPAEVGPFARLLAELPTVALGVRVLCTIRCDCLTRLSGLPYLGPLASGALQLLPPLDEAGLRAAIVEPARAFGYEFEAAGDVEALLAFARGSDGALPLLQFALGELWALRDTRRRLIPADALERIGGAAGALGRHAERVFAQLRAEEQAASRALLVRLATARGLRLRRTASELGGGSGERLQSLLPTLVRGRLLTVREGDGGQSEYTLSHEGLVDGWPRLRAWLASDSQAALARERVLQAAREWERLERAPALLLRAPQLDEHDRTQLDERTLPPLAVTFLGASRSRLRAERRRRVGRWLAVPLIVALGAGGWALRQRLRLDAEVALHEAHARRALALAQDEQLRDEALRREAFAKFDTRRAAAGEALWAQALERAAAAKRHRAEAERALERAFILDGARASVRGALGEVLYAAALAAEREGDGARASALADRFGVLDPSGALAARWGAEATLALETTPSGFSVTARRFERDGSAQRRVAGAPVALGVTPLRGVALAPGSYLLVLSRGAQVVRWPVLLERGERLSESFSVPAEARPGYVFVPAGRFLYGSREPEDLRRNHLYAQPLHPVRTRGYWIGRTEVRFREYLAFLNELAPSERERRRPRTGALHGGVELRLEPGGRWLLELTPTTQTHRAREGERLEFSGRAARRSVDWLELPVTGVSSDDARAYAAWLAATGRLPRAALCDEHQWERAARGADDRLYPHGDALLPGEANFDETYGRVTEAFGPDEVGAYPESESPFGVADLAGNVWEWARSVDADDEACYRGGGWYENRMNARSTNRQVGEPSQRDLIIGFRVCAPAE